MQFLISYSNGVLLLGGGGAKRIYDLVEAETKKSLASFQIIQVSSEALLRMRLE